MLLTSKKIQVIYFSMLFFIVLYFALPVQASSSAFFLVPQKNTKELEKRLNTLKDEILNPQIEFRKISPVRYRIRFHEAKKAFPLIMSETYNQGWQAWLVPVWKTQIQNQESMLKCYQVFPGAENFQADLQAVQFFLQHGFISTLGTGIKRQRLQYNFNADGTQTLIGKTSYCVDYISKNFKNTIQNDNLPEGNFWETWFGEGHLTATDGDNYKLSVKGKVLSLPEELHWKANGYANSWWISPEALTLALGEKAPEYFIQNLNGTVSFEIVIAYAPQKQFICLLFTSALTIITCIIFIIIFDCANCIRSFKTKLKLKSCAILTDSKQ